ncbi:MAG: hypothetical protein CBC13_02285 [Planctomycetia bacterium TMED53]|nr:MAG: hypothetical protein CBC13_02285 [Planctomycetia bacterium TMED53]
MAFVQRTLLGIFLFLGTAGLHLFIGQQGAAALGHYTQQDGTDVKEELTKRLTEEQEARWILDAVDRMPEDVRQPKGMSIGEIQKLTDEILLRGEGYLRNHPEGKNVPMVVPALCRIYLMNCNRHFIDSGRLYKERNGQDAPAAWTAALKKGYFDRIHTLLDGELAKVEEGSEAPCELIRLKADAFWHGQQYPRCINEYKRILERCPDDEDMDVVLTALLNAQIRDRDHKGAAATADQFLAAHTDSDLLPHVLRLKAKALQESGRLLDCLRWWKSIEGVIENAFRGDPLVFGDKTVEISDRCRKDFQRYYEEVNFAIGFLEFALGNYKEASESFTREMEILTELINAQAASQVGQIYAKRTERVLESLLRFAGKPTPAISLGENWVGGVAFDPAQEKGNVLLILFAPYENPRYLETLENLQRLYMAHGNDGLRIGWIASSKGRSDKQEQIDRLTRQCAQLGLAFPAGLDLEEGSPNFGQYNCPVGGATMVAVDRNGNLAWYKLDPTFRDDSIITQVAIRLLAESP